MLRKLAIPLALFVTLGTSGLMDASALEPFPDDVDDYLIRNTVTGRYLTVANHDALEGNAVVEYDADGIDVYNRWVRYSTADGKAVFTSYSSELVLTINAEGILTVAEREAGNRFQQFTVDGNAFSIDAGGLALSPDASETNGALVRLGETTERSEWELIPITNNTHAKGDVNRDGVVDVFDLGLAKGFLLGTYKADVEQTALANVNADIENRLDVTDVILLTKYLHGVSELTLGTGNFTANTIFPEVDFEITQPSVSDVLTADSDTLPLGTALSELGTPDELLSATYTDGEITFAVFAQTYGKMTIAIVCENEIVGYYRLCNTYAVPEGYRVTEYTDDLESNGQLYAILALKNGVSIACTKLADSEGMEILARLNCYAVNGVRALNGLYSYQWDDTLAACAASHSLEMAEMNYFSHNSYDGSSPLDRLNNFGIIGVSVGENIYAGGSDPFHVLNKWYNSENHRPNLLSDLFTHIGVGFAYGEASTYGFYGTQNFAKLN